MHTLFSCFKNGLLASLVFLVQLFHPQSSISAGYYSIVCSRVPSFSISISYMIFCSSGSQFATFPRLISLKFCSRVYPFPSCTGYPNSLFECALYQQLIWVGLLMLLKVCSALIFIPLYFSWLMVASPAETLSVPNCLPAWLLLHSLSLWQCQRWLSGANKKNSNNNCILAQDFEQQGGIEPCHCPQARCT